MSLAKKYSKKTLVCGLASLSLLLGPVSGSSSNQTAFEQKVATYDSQRTSKVTDLDQLDVATVKFDSKKVSSSFVLTDNDESFKEKLKIINNAKRGDTLRLVYFIYSDDKSSSVVSQALLDAANKKGVTTKLLLDLHTNYGRLDLFRALGKKSNNKIQVRFYNRPTRNIQLSAAYITTSCDEKLANPLDDTDCQDAKLKNLNAKLSKKPVLNVADASDRGSVMEGLFLSGLYAKNDAALKTAVSVGADINFSEFALGNSKTSNPEDLKDLGKLGALYWKSKTADSVWTRFGAKVQLGFAGLMYGSKIDPVINLFSGLLPASMDAKRTLTMFGHKSANGKDMNHLTDYTHHKLLLLTDRAKNAKSAQMGGRNIEDSYHVGVPAYGPKSNRTTIVHKYLFMDTDLKVNFERGSNSKGLANSFDKMFDHTAMVIDIAGLDALMPNDFVATISAQSAACETGLTKTTDGERPNLFGTNLTLAGVKENACKANIASPGAALNALQNPMSRSSRINAAISKMKQNVVSYNKYEAALNLNRKSNSPLAMSVDAGAKFSYLENTHFKKTLKSNEKAKNIRTYGLVDRARYAARYDLAESNKNIHAALISGMKAVCDKSVDKPQEITLQNAYVAPSSSVLRAFANMVDGTWNCAGVTLRIITNSYMTTDLVPVNTFGRHQIKAVIEYARRVKELTSKGATIQYFEYQYSGNGVDRASNRSLHSKVSLLGDEMIIVGSANLDFRSIMMDTNNAMLIEKAPKLVESYKQFLDKKIRTDRHPKGLIMGLNYNNISRGELITGPSSTQTSDSSGVSDGDFPAAMAALKKYNVVLKDEDILTLSLSASKAQAEAGCTPKGINRKSLSSDDKKLVDASIAECVELVVEKSESRLATNEKRVSALRNYVSDITEKVYELSRSIVANVGTYSKGSTLWHFGFKDEPHSNLSPRKEDRGNYYFRFKIQHDDGKKLDSKGGVI